MSEHNPFLTMCELWGTEVAKEKCKEFNIDISPLDLLKARGRDAQKRKNLAAIVAQIRGKPSEEVSGNEL